MEIAVKVSEKEVTPSDPKHFHGGKVIPILGPVTKTAKDEAGNEHSVSVVEVVAYLEVREAAAWGLAQDKTFVGEKA
jgi:hypothetical protein